MTAALLGCLVAACGPDPQELRARAERSFAAGEYRAAIIDIRNLIRESPSDAKLRLRHGQALTRTRDFMTAVTELGKARELGAPEGDVAIALAEAFAGSGDFAAALAELDRPGLARDLAGLDRLRGQALLGLKRESEAIGPLSRALTRDPADLAARLALAQARGRTQGPAAAREELDIALKMAPKDPQVHMLRGAWSGQAQQLDDARTEFNTALSLAEAAKDATTQAAALAAITEVELIAGRTDAAAASLGRLQQVAGASAPALLLQARIASQQGNLDRAKTSLQELLTRQPDHVQAKLLMGAVELALGNLGQAEMYVAAAASANPQDQMAQRLLAEVRSRQSRARDVLEGVPTGSDELGSDALASAARASILVGDLHGAVRYLERSREKAPGAASRTLDLAAGYIAAGRNEDALELLRPLPETAATLHIRELLLLTALAKSGKLEEARKTASEFARQHGDDVLAVSVAARAMLSAADVPAARDLLREFAARNPKESRPWLLLGALESSQRDFPAADRAFAEALRRDPASSEALLARSQLAAAQGDRFGAIERLETARDSLPKSLPVRLALAQLYLADGNIVRATKAMEEARRLAPNDPDVGLIDAAMALRAQRIPDAIRIYEQVVDQRPDAIEPRIGLARAYLLAGRTPDAERSVERALQIDPGYWPALALRSSLAIADGNYEEASKRLTQLRSSTAPAALVAMLEGDMAMRRGSFAEGAQRYAMAAQGAPTAQLALKEYAAHRAAKDADAQMPLRKWLERSPGDWSVRLALAQDLMSTNDHPGAIREYETVLRVQGDNVVALNNLAVLKLDAGDTAAATSLALKAYQRAPNAAAVADTHGWVLARTGKAKQAVPILERAYAAAPDNEIRYHLAFALNESGEPARARPHLEALTALGDRQPVAAQARKLLESLRDRAP
jgi:putative PEP-CTERM system TPR-repeat lipoprotein